MTLFFPLFTCSMRILYLFTYSFFSFFFFASLGVRSGGWKSLRRCVGRSCTCCHCWSLCCSVCIIIVIVVIIIIIIIITLFCSFFFLSLFYSIFHSIPSFLDLKIIFLFLFIFHFWLTCLFCHFFVGHNIIRQAFESHLAIIFFTRKLNLYPTKCLPFQR